MRSARLMIDPPALGAWNMAVDEALLRSAAETGVATLRFYLWSEPTLSLGYFQAADDRQQHAASLACPVVRRASGGGAIVHDRELTYSLTVPLSNTRTAQATRLYDSVHASLLECLAALGVVASLYSTADSCQSAASTAKASQPFLCFQRRTCGDIVCEGAKIVGSAQRRRRGAVLQHGSILLARSSSAPELPGIYELTGYPLTSDDIVTRLVGFLEAKPPFHFEVQPLVEKERVLANSMLNAFRDDIFTYRR